MSFSCPHVRPDDESCLRLKTNCVPGRRGWVLEGNSGIAVPAEVREREREAEKRRSADEKWVGETHRRERR